MSPAPDETCPSSGLGCKNDSCRWSSDCLGELTCVRRKCSSAIKRTDLKIIGISIAAICILALIGAIALWWLCAWRRSKKMKQINREVFERQKQMEAERERNGYVYSSHGTTAGSLHPPQASHGTQFNNTGAGSPFMSPVSPYNTLPNSPMPQAAVPMTPAPSYAFAVSNPVAELPSTQTQYIELEAVSRPTTAATGIDSITTADMEGTKEDEKRLLGVVPPKMPKVEEKNG